MELRDLRYFAEVVGKGQIYRAAEALKLTQPALTKCIRRLEQELGVQLLERTARGIRPTAAGRQLLQVGGRIANDLDDLRKELQEQAHGVAGHLRIGTGLAPALYLLPVACARLIKRTPNVTFEIRSGSGDAQIPLLQEGKLDLVLGGYRARPSPSLGQETVLNDRVVVVGRAGHPLLQKGGRPLKPAQLAAARWALSDGHSLTTQWLDRRFVELGLETPKSTVRSDSVLALLSIVANSDLLTFLSWSGVKRSRYESALVPLRCPPIEWNRTITATYRRQGYIPQALPHLIEMLKATAASELHSGTSPG